jgi:hypothetical protein
MTQRLNSGYPFMGYSRYLRFTLFDRTLGLLCLIGVSKFSMKGFDWSFGILEIFSEKLSSEIGEIKP